MAVRQRCQQIHKLTILVHYSCQSDAMIIKYEGLIVYGGEIQTIIAICIVTGHRVPNGDTEPATTNFSIRFDHNRKSFLQGIGLLLQSNFQFLQVKFQS